MERTYSLDLDNLGIFKKQITFLKQKNVKLFRYKNSSELKEFLFRLYDKKKGYGLTIKEIAHILNKDRRIISKWFYMLNIRIINGCLLFGKLTNKYDKPHIKSFIKYIPYIPKEDLLWVCGFAIGEGSSNVGTLEIGNNEFKFIPILKKVLSRYGKINILYDKITNKYDRNKRELSTVYLKNVIEKNSNYFRIRLFSSAFSRMIKNEVEGYNKDTIKTALKRKETALPFIAGLWDGEGWIFWKDYNRKNGYNELVINIGISQKNGLDGKFLMLNVEKCINNTFGLKTIPLNSIVESTFIKNNKKYHHKINVIGFKVSSKKDMIKWVDYFVPYMKHPKKILNAKRLLVRLNENN